LNFKIKVAKLLFWIFTARKILAINFKQHLNFLRTRGWRGRICVGDNRIGEIGKRAGTGDLRGDEGPEAGDKRDRTYKDEELGGKN
jgi:hypothetical protein